MPRCHQTCRFCDKIEFDYDTLVQYGRRHWAHHACYLDKRPLHKLDRRQIGKIPYRLLKERGLLEEATECCRL